MKVSFYDDFTVVIDDGTRLKLGDMLLNFIDRDFSDFISLCDNLIISLRNIEPCNHGNTTLSQYLRLTKQVKEFEDKFKKTILTLPFYKISQPKYLFATNELIRETNGCLKWCDKETLLADANFEFNSDYHDMVIEIVENYECTITECSSFFKELTDYCLLGENISPIDKLYEYGLQNVIDKINKMDHSSYSSFSLEHKIKIVNDKPVLIEVYNLTTPAQYLYQEFINLIKNGLRIKKCANCGRYFVLYSGHSIEYCDNIPEGETKPCTLIGPARIYVKKLKSDPILEQYTRSYKTHFSRKRAGYLTPEQFKVWSKEAKLMRSRAYSGDITLDEFTAWCKD